MKIIVVSLFDRLIIATTTNHNQTNPKKPRVSEWPSGLCSLRQVTEVKLGRVRSKLWMGDLGGLTLQLTLSSFGRDVKLGVPCLDVACTVGLN